MYVVGGSVTAVAVIVYIVVFNGFAFNSIASHFWFEPKFMCERIEGKKKQASVRCALPSLRT
jgi:hypothetical protein